MTATATVKERPILFSRAMVLAIRDGRKTQTRRMVKPQPDTYQGQSGLQFEWPGWHGSLGAESFARYCPYGGPGERLWVRESWALVRPWCDPDTGSVEDAELWDEPMPASLPAGWRIWYAADSDDITSHPGDRIVKRWRPSIFMPRWASRMTLEITEVRVERLKSISEADAIAEGARRFDDIPLDPWHERDPAHADRWSMQTPATTGQCLSTARFAFGNLWEKINGEGSWDINPWVWAVSFRRTSQEQHS